MPFYEYQCKACGAQIEVLQKITDAPLKKCTACGQNKLVKLVSAPVFRLKGSGWYETDFKSDKDQKRNLVDADKGETKDAGAGDKSDAKPEAKADASNDARSEPKTDAPRSDAKAEPKPSGKGESKAAAPAAKPARKRSPSPAKKARPRR